MKIGIKKIEVKSKLGIPLTEQEKAYYVVYSRILKREVLNETTNI